MNSLKNLKNNGGFEDSQAYTESRKSTAPEILSTGNRTQITEVSVQQMHTGLIPIYLCTAYFIAILTGATIFPVCPTCMSLGTKPASTAAREAPTKGGGRGNGHFFLSLIISASRDITDNYKKQNKKPPTLIQYS